MLDYLQRFKQLPQEIREKVSNQEASKAISDLENKYNVALFAIVMKVTVGDISLDKLNNHLIRDLDMSEKDATGLADELRQNIFKNIEEHLKENTPSSEAKGEAKKGFSRSPSFLKKFKFLPKRKKYKQLSSPEEDDSPRDEDQGVFEKEKKDSVEEREGGSGGVQGDGSASFFSPEDEKEIKKISEEMSSIKKEESNNSGLEEKLEKVVREVNINFSSEASKDRFKNIIFTFFRGVRNQLATRQALLKDYDKGGLSLSEDVSEKIIKAASKYKDGLPSEKNIDHQEEVKEESREKSNSGDLENTDDPPKQETQEVKDKGEEKEKVEIDSSPEKGEKDSEKLSKKSLDLEKLPQRDIDYDLASVLKEKFDQEKEGGAGKEEAKKESQASSKEKKQEKKVKVVDRKEKEEKKESEDKSEEKIVAKKEVPKKDVAAKESPKKSFRSRIKRSFSPSEKGKKQIEDIKKAPKLINPINELKYMDLVSFRRLGEDGSQRTDKIKEKLDSLGKKYFAEKLDGIKAWRQSPVNRLYLEIGRDSIVYNKSVDDIIKEKGQQNKDCLSKSEFEAIMELNDKLRFY